VAQSDNSPNPVVSQEDQQLADSLLARGLVTEAQLERARSVAAERSHSLWRTVVSMNLVTPQQVAEALGRADAGGAAGRESTGGGLPAVAVGRSSEEVKAELAQTLQGGSAPQVVQRVFQSAFDTRSTDIHFDPNEEGVRIRFRVDGQLHDVLNLGRDQAQAVFSRIKILANMDIVERRAAQDGHINLPAAGGARDLRIATVPTSQGEKLVVRVLDTSTMLTGLDQLGLEPDQGETLREMTEQPYGMLLVAGPVGSGKTTTLYSCLNRVNESTKNCMTIEDPVEYRLQGVSQLQVDLKTQFTFGAGLRAMLRQDPDIIMVGEIRDDDTASIGVRAALTGVLVFSSIHANDAAAVVGNLYNYKIPGFLISNALLGVVAQRLVRRVHSSCRETYDPDEATLKIIGKRPEGDEEIVFSRGRGCAECFQTGYLGRTGIFEVMSLDEELRDLVFRQTTKEVLRQVAVDMGMSTLKEAAIKKVAAGTTTVEEMVKTVLV